MAELGAGRPPPADLEAAIAALPAKKEALREAFDSLAACSPYPLPFTWDGLDAHISSIQSSISRRFRQLQVLEAARPVPAIPAPEETRSCENHNQQQQQGEEEEEEEEVEVEEEEEEEEEEDNDDGEDGQGEKQEDEEEVGEEEEVEEEEVEEEEVEEEVVEEAEDATMDEGKQQAEVEIQLNNGEDWNVMEEPQVSGKVDEQNADEEVHEEGKEEQEAEEEEESPCIEPGAKNAAVSPNDMDMAQKQIQPALVSKDLMATCASMDANMLVKFRCCKRNILWKEFNIAMRHAPDAAALVLQVVKLFLSSKKFKATKVWNKCISLIQCVPMAISKPLADTIEQAKQVAKDWKEMIYSLECPGDLELLGAWGLLYFLISYNIVSEFDTSDIIRLFSMVPRHKQNKNTMELCKGLGIADRITDLIDYLIGKGQQLEVYHLAHVFNLSDKYPLLSLLMGYIEKAKQTSMEIQSKSLNSAIPKEVENLWVVHHLTEQKITDSSQRDALVAEIKTLLDGYARKKKRLAKSFTSNLQTEQKRCKKEEHELHKGLNLQQD